MPSTALLAADQAHEVEATIRNNRIKQTVCRWCYDKIPLEDLVPAGGEVRVQGN